MRSLLTELVDIFTSSSTLYCFALNAVVEVRLNLLEERGYDLNLWGVSAVLMLGGNLTAGSLDFTLPEESMKIKLESC